MKNHINPTEFLMYQTEQNLKMVIKVQEEIAGLWNGKESGEQEALIDKLKEIEGLFELKENGDPLTVFNNLKKLSKVLSNGKHRTRNK